MKTPVHQNMFRRIRWIVLAFLTLGAALGAITNAISLFPRNVTYFGTTIVIVFAVLIRFLVKRRPVEWVIFGHAARIKNPTAVTNTAIALLVLLWIPRAGDWFRDSQIQETETQGYLVPASDANPPNPCEDSIPVGAMIIYLGNSVAYIEGNSSDIIILDNERVLSFTRTSDGIFINATLRSKDGRGIVVIENNEFTINRNNFWYKKRPDKHTLEVYDEFKERILYVRYLNEDAIKIVGNFYAKNISIPPAIIGEDKQILSRIQSSADCIGELRFFSGTFTLPVDSLPKDSLSK